MFYSFVCFFLLCFCQLEKIGELWSSEKMGKSVDCGRSPLVNYFSLCMPKEKSFYEFFFELAIFFKFIAPAEGFLFLIVRKEKQK